jgi:hypothetical protein
MIALIRLCEAFLEGATKHGRFDRYVKVSASFANDHEAHRLRAMRTEDEGLLDVRRL